MASSIAKRQPHRQSGVISVGLAEIALIGPLPRRLSNHTTGDPWVSPDLPQLLEDMSYLLGIGLLSMFEFDHCLKERDSKGPFRFNEAQGVLYDWFAAAVLKGIAMLRKSILNPGKCGNEQQTVIKRCPTSGSDTRESLMLRCLGGAATRQSDAAAYRRGGLTTLFSISAVVPKSFARHEDKLIICTHCHVGDLTAAGPSAQLWNVRVETTPSWDLCKDKLPTRSLLEACSELSDRMQAVRRKIFDQRQSARSAQPKLLSLNKCADAALEGLPLDIEDEDETTVTSLPPSFVAPSHDIPTVEERRKDSLDFDLRHWRRKYFPGADALLAQQMRAVQADYHATAPWYGQPPIALPSIDTIFGEMRKEDDRLRPDKRKEDLGPPWSHKTSLEDYEDKTDDPIWLPAYFIWERVEPSAELEHIAAAAETNKESQATVEAWNSSSTDASAVEVASGTPLTQILSSASALSSSVEESAGTSGDQTTSDRKDDEDDDASSVSSGASTPRARAQS